MHRLVKAAASLVLAMLLLVTASLPAAAHAPTDMTVVYNDRLDVLVINIKHSVKDPKSHYVDHIEVWLGPALVIDKVYTSQPSNNFNVEFTLDADVGDIVTVKAYCNQMGCIEQTLEVEEGITAVGEKAAMLDAMMTGHMVMQVVAIVLAVVAMPGGMGFWRAFKTRSRPKGRRRIHARIGGAAVVLLVVGSLSGMWIVSMTSGDYLGSPHGWLAVATIASAVITGYSASPKFKKAGYAMRMQTHMPLSLLTIGLAVATALSGMMAAGMF